MRCAVASWAYRVFTHSVQWDVQLQVRHFWHLCDQFNEMYKCRLGTWGICALSQMRCAVASLEHGVFNFSVQWDVEMQAMHMGYLCTQSSKMCSCRLGTSVFTYTVQWDIQMQAGRMEYLCTQSNEMSVCNLGDIGI